MNKKRRSAIWLRTALAVLAVATCPPASLGEEPIRVAPAKLPRLRTIDERFQSFNVEMVEVTGGRFWAPCGKQINPAPETMPAAQLSAPKIDPATFRTRPPIDLPNPRLHKLAAALGPAYTRVSGTRANSTYFHDPDDPPPPTPTVGFGGMLTPISGGASSIFPAPSMQESPHRSP